MQARRVGLAGFLMNNATYSEQVIDLAGTDEPKTSTSDLLDKEVKVCCEFVLVLIVRIRTKADVPFEKVDLVFRARTSFSKLSRFHALVRVPT